MHPNLNVVKDLKSIMMLEIKGNENLRQIDNVRVLESFQYLTSIDLSNNRLENIPEIIQCLNPSIRYLDVSGSNAGKVNVTTFQKFTHLRELLLANTSFPVNDSELFDSLQSLIFIDVSYNDLEHFDFKRALLNLKRLEAVRAANCTLAKIPEFGSTLKALHISDNFLRELKTNSFKSVTNLRALNVSNTHLSSVDFDVFEHNPKLEVLDLSYNSLQRVNLTLAMSNLRWFRLNGNNITNIEGFIKSRLPRLYELDISNNQLSCEYLTAFVAQLKREWPKLELIGDPWKQKHDQNCNR
ncbi:protein artichoke-like [Sitodiplosis mosellana]|uniref:protein artichoke-like n=1 Tax=Sitodiplosis mosellana TaxID=263140 RepID=UPI0024442EB8|nr:protein artichoke-like [Sitodiplosis mosellana]